MKDKDEAKETASSVILSSHLIGFLIGASVVIFMDKVWPKDFILSWSEWLVLWGAVILIVLLMAKMSYWRGARLTKEIGEDDPRRN